MKRWAHDFIFLNIFNIFLFFSNNYIFVGAAVDEKTAEQKPKKSQNFGYPLSVFFIYLPNCKSYTITVFTNRLSKKFRTKPIHQLIFRERRFPKNQNPQIISLSGGRLVKLSDKVVTFSFVFYGDGRSGLWGELLDRLESVHK